MNTFKLRLKNRRGLTLIEIIIALGLFGILVLILTNLFDYNIKAFSNSEKLSQVQFDTRMASDYIIKEVRNTQSISLNDSTLPEKIDIDKLNETYLSVKSIMFEIKIEGNIYMLAYSIQSSDIKGNNQYSLNSEVVLNNIKNATIGKSGNIYYE